MFVHTLIYCQFLFQKAPAAKREFLIDAQICAYSFFIIFLFFHIGPAAKKSFLIDARVGAY